MCLTYKNHIFVVTTEREKSATGNTSNLTVFFSWHSLIMLFIKRSWLYLKNVISRHVVSLRTFFFTSSALLYGGPMLIFKSKFAVPLFLSSRAAGNHKENLISSLQYLFHFLFSFSFQLLNMRSDVLPIARL